MSDLINARIHITGIVQGVGFRPFVFALAKRLSLNGWVRNTSAGVDIEVDGATPVLEAFAEALQKEAPPLARIDEISIEYQHTQGFTSFEITPSQPIPDAFQPISPDVSICPDCLNELFDLRDRRFLYPFINCTNCGPRFTIIEDIPYDRPKTTMAGFEMCQDCASEYHDPLNRRFHAQPIACPICGPQTWLEFNLLGNTKQPEELDSIIEAQRLLRDGKIVAIKGLGGFHLACDALNSQAVAELRRRKLRVDKPFALMISDIAVIEAHCELNVAERELIESRQRPIVILHRKPSSPISSLVAPGQDTRGVMLPYTPLHYLLYDVRIDPASNTPPPQVLVMTSGNVSEEPIAIENDEARQRLASLADAFLMHNRPIRTRCDDSVMRVFAIPAATSLASTSDIEITHTLLPIRRSRGYAPFPVHLPWQLPPLLAVGAELKNAFCLTRDRYAFISHHIGDLENYETLRSFENGIQHFERLFRVQPQALAYDLHPNYLASRYALERAERTGLPAFGIQHHHAHIAACMVEHNLSGDQPIIGVSFDGTGFGEDNAIWGGEFLIADYQGYQRPYHLTYVPLPGGDKAIREPWRMALAWLANAGIPWSEDLPPVRHVLKNIQDANRQLEILRQQIETGLNAPPTSSMGRLFDAIAALVGVRQQVNYEAQAAIELETLADSSETGYYTLDPKSVFRESQDQLTQTVDASPIIQAIISDLCDGVPVSTISARFHNTLALLVLQICKQLRDLHQINQVALSGGVWQNMTLLKKTCELLIHDHFTLYTHQQVPPNDGGIALGQAAIAAYRLVKGI